MMTQPNRPDPTLKINSLRDGGKRFRMLTRDPNKDSYISATILAGELWEPFVREPLIQAIKGQSLPVFIDVGANVGYFTHTALAMGARVISFEPIRANMGPLMATIEENKWQDRWAGKKKSPSRSIALTHIFLPFLPGSQGNSYKSDCAECV